MNKCYDQLRLRKRNREHIADEKTWAIIAERISDGFTTDLENNETAMMINLLTNKLSPKQKAVFILSEIEEMSAEEVSEVTGLSKSGIKANLYFARKKITELIEKYL